eukprot:259512-Amphidinium_carterae.1
MANQTPSSHKEYASIWQTWHLLGFCGKRHLVSANIALQEALNPKPSTVQAWVVRQLGWDIHAQSASDL